MSNLVRAERDRVTRELRDMALRVAEQKFLVTLKATKGRNTKLDGEVVRLYAGTNLGALVAGLCDEILRLRDGLAAIAESADGMQYKPHDYARTILDGTSMAQTPPEPVSFSSIVLAARSDGEMDEREPLKDITGCDV